jgi:cytochrome c-type biogenesis protein
METGTSIGILIAFAGGILSFLSPCVLPLVPSYISFITGFSLDELGQKRQSAMVHAALFISGFTIIFMLLGASASAIGYAVNVNRVWLERFGGLLIIVFGLYMLGVFNWGWLARERRVHLQNKPVGYLGSVLVGVAFGAGWTPCIGPILGGILLMTSTRADLSEGMLALFAYSMGLAVPFMIAALGVERFIGWFQKHRHIMPVVTKASGALLVGVGILLISGYFTVLATWLQGLTPEFLLERI